MFQAIGGGDRKRRRPLQSTNPQPLAGLVICLTGLSDKNRLHALIEKLGGCYCRDLDTSRSTHLISQSPGQGAKYETACKGNMFIVTPEWLEACLAAEKRVDESRYPVVNDLPLGESLTKALDDATTARSRLFYACKFLILGFDSDGDEYRLLQRIISRGRGTIYWDLNECITHVIVKDAAPQILQDAAHSVSNHHPLSPRHWSPRWIIASWLQQELIAPANNYLPRRPVPIVSKQSKKQEPKHNNRRSLILKSCIICLVRLAPPSGAVDFESRELASSIVKNGGQLLNQKVVDALKGDASAGKKKRTVHAIFWGGYSPTHVNIHSLLTQIQACSNILPVTPIWLMTALADEKVPTQRLSLFFTPTSWPLLKLTDHNLVIAVTGFVASERTALIQLLKVVGVAYTETFNKKMNTHLICKAGSSGRKYVKAMEWKLHVVSVEWLLHVMQYGYGGVEGNKLGCEDDFRVKNGDGGEEMLSQESQNHSVVEESQK